MSSVQWNTSFFMSNFLKRSNLPLNYIDNNMSESKKNAITLEISARVETEYEGGNHCFLYLYLGFYACVYEYFSPGWNFLTITWGISVRSTGLKISSRVAQTGLKFQFGSQGWNFLHAIANSVLQGFYRKPGMNFLFGQPGWKFISGWKSPCNQPLRKLNTAFHCI